MTSQTRLTRAAAVIAVGAMSAFGLAACSAAEPSAPAGDGPAVTISYLHRLPDGEGMTPVADIVARWNAENPTIQVEATKFDGAASDMILKLETDINAGTGPCLAQLGYAEVPQMFVKGLLQDVASEADKYADDFSAGAFGMMRVGDAVVGLPQDTGPLVYFYNATEFENLGLAVPATLEDLSSESATAAAAGKYITAFTPDEAMYWLSAQAAAAGDVWFTTENDEWAVDAEGAGSQKVAAFWQGLVDNKQTIVTERWGDGFPKALADGSLIGHVGAAWEAGFLLDSLDGTSSEGQWRVAQLPDFGAGAMTGPDGGSGVAVMEGCEHPAEAMAFNDWFNTQIDDLASQGLVVAANGTPQSSEKMQRQFGGQDVLAALAEASANLNPDFAYAPGFASLTKMNETAAGVGAGTSTVADVFTTAQTTAVATLKDLGLPVAE
ncbi:carbohydrate ABC transporter substrate-binding protein (CUT1 family) [Microterricola gilva]|uniref:Carbohydrate ABC transporter substrate-binding protein (CUT1 family) n=1 Tax=Microterricola gilva TaxID=393267 RepID=A0A4Q8AK95_9MICO|nr:ABC transporter substrate-binding protein [Microterricola gilva]RZU64249.1 carbohydrate ABC transporter substrate-binding protein (CUT1 family) [Microterricola gilva]